MLGRGEGVGGKGEGVFSPAHILVLPRASLKVLNPDFTRVIPTCLLTRLDESPLAW